MSPTVILLGDFNIHIDNPANGFAKDFISLLECLGITQYVNFPTHNKGHILDLVCCTGVTPFNLTDAEFPISDHKSVLFEVNVPLSKTRALRTITFRNIKRIDPRDLNSLITPCPVHPHPPPQSLLNW